jgi:hypothetical protein
MSLSFEDLFAIRFSLQDVFIDESEIVKRLKLKLINIGMDEDEVNNYLVNFYNSYGISFQLDEIKDIKVNELLPSSSNFQTNNNQFNNNAHPNIFNNGFVQFLINSNNILNQNNNIDNDDEINSENDHQLNNEINNNEINNNENINQNNSNNEDLNEDSDTDFSDLPELETIDEEIEEEINNELDDNLEGLNQNLYTNNSINLNFNGRNYTFQTNNGYPNLISSNFQNIFQSFINNVENQQNMDDVIVTLDDKDLSDIKSYKYIDNGAKNKCTICYENLEKDEIVSELKCEHIFHKECIDEYLKNYNYKCPVCRSECGKPKYNT